MVTHVLEAEAIRDYLRCPQEYAYRWLYVVPDPPQRVYQTWLRCLRRAALTVVREAMEGPVSIDRTYLIWQLHAQHTVASQAKWDIKGRELLLQFYEWLQFVKPAVIGPTRRQLVTFSSPQRQADVELSADFAGDWRNRLTYILLTPPDPGIVSAYAAADSAHWATFDLEKGRAKSIPTQTTYEDAALSGRTEQAVRGLTRKIIWPNRDSRCQSCAYSDVCDGRDARTSALRNSTSRIRVRDRIARERKLV